MNTYHRSSQHDQFPWGPSGPGRRGSRIRSKFVTPEVLLRRRLGLLVLVGLCAAPVAWALRGEGGGVDVTTTGGAAVVVQLDSTDQTPLSSTTTANTALPPAIAETTLATPTTQVVMPTQATPICGSTYIVQSGDSWFAIATAAGTKASLIAGINNKTIRSPLMVGQEICLPPGAEVPALRPTAASFVTPAHQMSCSANYTVVVGDSWSRIADKANTTISQMTSVNAMTTKSVLLIGQKICLPKGTSVRIAAVAPAPAPQYQAPRTFSRSEVEQIIRDEWPDSLEENALFVADRETHLNPLSHNWCCIGLFQMYWNVHKSWMKNYGVTNSNQLYDPRTNAKLAYAMYKRSNSWGPWCTRNWCPKN
ncbi:MAG: LysM peptidoglycan-binding domain-containing protein [Actinomycetes bacterium]